MNSIPNYSTMCCSPNFGLKLFGKKAEEKKSSELLKEKGVTIESSSLESNICCNTQTGIAVLKYNDKEYDCRIPSYFVDGGYYDRYEGRYIPYSLREEEASKYILEKYAQSGDVDMTKFLEKNNEECKCFMYGKN